LAGWNKRIKLSYDKTNVSANLTNFPILLKISASSGYNADDISCVFDELTSDANRLKIAVTTSDGTTENYVEIERWDDANEVAWLWVLAPAISSVANTDFYLYYDHTHADNSAHVGDPESAAGITVWASYAVVHHLKDEGADDTVQKDSTSGNHDGTPSSMASTCFGQTGKIGKSVHFPSADGDKISVAGGMTVISDDDTWTIETWIYHDASQGAVIWSRSSAGSCYLYIFAGEPANLRFNVGNPAYFDTNTTPIASGAWYHIVCTKTATSTGSIYVNGQSIKSGTLSDMPSQDEPLNLGNYNDADLNNFHFDGLIDEFRICTSVLSDAWIKASYYTGADLALDWGTEETAGKKGNSLVATITEMLNSKMLFG